MQTSTLHGSLTLSAISEQAFLLPCLIDVYLLACSILPDQTGCSDNAPSIAMLNEVDMYL